MWLAASEAAVLTVFASNRSDPPDEQLLVTLDATPPLGRHRGHKKSQAKLPTGS